jgi:RHS repeat-associated protein
MAEVAQALERGVQEDLVPAAKDAAQAVENAVRSVAHGAEGVAGRAESTEADLAGKFAQVGSKDAGGALSGAEADAAHAGTSAADDAGGGGLAGRGGGQTSEGNANVKTGGDPVDVVSGQMVTSKTDLVLLGTLPLVLRRAYASGYQGGRLLGPGWSSTLDQRVVIDGDGIHYAGDDAQILHYPIPTQPGQRVLPAEGARWPLTWDRASDTIRIEEPDRGWTRHFTTLGATRGASGETRPITALSNRNGHRITYACDDDGVPTEVQHSGGYRVAVDTTYTAAGFRIEGLRLLDGTNGNQGTQIQGYQYDPRGRLAGIVDSSGIPYIYEHDDADRITAWINRNGYRYEYEYDESGRVVRATGEDGYLSAAFSYDTENLVTTQADSLGQTTEYHFDADRHLIKTVDPLGDAVLTRYDRFGRLVAATDALGNTTSYVLDEQGNPTRVERPDGTSLTLDYNELGLVSEVTKPDSARWTYDFDERGNMLTATGPLGVVGTFVYDDRGCLVSATDGLGRIEQVASYGSGLPHAVTGPDGAVTRYERDAFGRISAVVDPDGETTRAGWTPDGRILWRESVQGREEWVYDAEGNLLELRGPQGSTTFEYGPFGLITSRVDASGARLRFKYDTERRLLSVTDSRDLSWHYTRDAAGRIVSETDYDGRTLIYRYDAAGRLVERVNAEGQSIAFTRDALGRAVATTDGDGARSQFELDAVGRLLRATSADHVLAYERDPLGRVVGESVDGAWLRNEFDAVGRRVRRTTPAEVGSEWTYDSGSRPLTLTTDGGTLTFSYDARGREVNRYLGPAAALTTAWDEHGRLAGQSIWSYQAPEPDAAQPDSPYSLVNQRTYAYDEAGRLSGVEDQATGARGYTYDGGRVVQVQAATWSETYVYTSAGDLAQASLERPGASPEPAASAEPHEFAGSRLISARGSNFEYDRQGRVVRRTRRTLSGQRRTWEYRWDAQDHLTDVTLPDGSTWHYEYDPIGRRIAKQHHDASGAVRTTVRFVWDGPQVAEETVVGEALVTTRTWNYEPGTFRPATQTERRISSPDAADVAEAADAAAITDVGDCIDLRFYAVVADLVGAPSELVTGDGRVAWRAEADLWGARLRTEAYEADCPLRFPGQYHDDETGWHYNHHRYYDPQTARYMSADPIGLPAGPNPYMYVIDPLRWMDPLGLTGTELPDPLPRVLNIGAGDQPMPGAVNIDLNPRADGVIQADANDLSMFQDGSFDAVHSINPYGFNPVNSETARVMTPGSILKVSGNTKANKFTRISPEAAREAGFEYLGEGPLDPEHQFGELKRTDGTSIADDNRIKTRTYKRLEPCG